MKIHERIEYYDISARTPRQLLAGMEENAPITAYSGVQHFAVAESYFKWSFSYLSSSEKCAVDDYDVSVDMHYVMPRWIDKERGSKRVVEYWDEFVQNLWIHERGHGDISLATGIEIAQAIGKIKPADSCSALNTTANEVAKNVLKERKNVQRDYDRKSRHGLLQGAYFDSTAARRGVKRKSE